MIGLVLVTHGRLAVEFRAALEHVVGPQAQIEAVTIGPEDDVEERRKDITKVLRQDAEGARVAVRNVRHDAMEDLKKAEKDGTISQDEHKRLQGDVQKLTDEAVRRVDEALKSKEQEIMQV